MWLHKKINKKRNNKNCLSWHFQENIFTVLSIRSRVNLQAMLISLAYRIKFCIHYRIIKLKNCEVFFCYLIRHVLFLDLNHYTEYEVFETVLKTSPRYFIKNSYFKISWNALFMQKYLNQKSNNKCLLLFAKRTFRNSHIFFILKKR